MNKSIGLLLAASLGVSLQAAEWSGKEEHINKSGSFLRIGYKSASGDLNIDDLYSKFTIPQKEKGLELSFGMNSGGSGVFGWRPLLTLIHTNGEASTQGRKVFSTSTTLFQGEFEFFAALHKYFQPFAGFHGGIGQEKFSGNGFDYSESLMAAQLGLCVGVAGDISKSIGYYLKVSKNYRNHPETSNGEFIDHDLTDTTAGISIKF